MATALAYVILGRADEAAGAARDLLSFSGALPSLKPDFYAELAQLQPMPGADGALQPALALLPFDDARMLLVYCQPGAGGSLTEHCVFLPLDAAPQAAALPDWLTRLPPPPSDIDMTVMTMPIPSARRLEPAARGGNLAWLLAQMPDGDLDSALNLLTLLVDEDSLRIVNFPADFKTRLALLAGLQALLPARLAARLSYATSQPLACGRALQLSFVDGETDSDALDWRELSDLQPAASHAYFDLLRELWRGDAAELTAEIQQLEALVGGADVDLDAALAALAERHWLNQQVAAGGSDLDTQVMLGAVDGDAPPYGPLRRQYFERLLHNALHKRDREAGRRVAEEMQRDAQLENQLLSALDNMLDDQPDAVYVFIRNRLRHLGIESAWTARLALAARSSLDVAIQDGDGGTLARWLELIAHEPPAYELEGALRDSILAARTRAYSDGELGSTLFLIAARRDPALVADLLADRELLAALDADVREALLSPSQETLDRLVSGKAEICLLALRRGMNNKGEALVSHALARRLWALAQSDERIDLPADCQPQALVKQLMTRDSQQLTDEALDYLFGRVIAGDDRDLTAAAAQHLAQRGALFPRLTQCLERETPPLDKAQAVMKAAASLPDSPPQAVIDAWFNLLEHYRWDEDARQLVEGLARLLMKHGGAQVASRRLWKLYESCQALQMEGGCRVAVARLLREYGEEEDPSLVVEGMARVCGQVAGSGSLQELVNAWWRDYAQSLALAQLQRLERELGAQRGMDAQKQILKTALAMRRWLHSRDAAGFAAAIDTAFTIVEQLAEAFDGEQPPEIDARTIRREVDALGADLSSEQRHILANNLRNLAQRITQMAEKRSKPSLIRSDDSIDWQLTHGEASPQGAVDMMKWVAGYLDGAHQTEEN